MSYYTAPGKVPLWDPCLFGLPVILTVAHMIRGQSYKVSIWGYIGSLAEGLRGFIQEVSRAHKVWGAETI